MDGYPLRFRFDDDEWGENIFRFVRQEPLLEENYVAQLPRLLDVYLTSRITFEEDPAGWTGYTINLSIDAAAICRDLAASAHDNLGHESSLSDGKNA